MTPNLVPLLPNNVDFTPVNDGQRLGNNNINQADPRTEIGRVLDERAQEALREMGRAQPTAPSSRPGNPTEIGVGPHGRPSTPSPLWDGGRPAWDGRGAPGNGGIHHNVPRGGGSIHHWQR